MYLNTAGEVNGRQHEHCVLPTSCVDFPSFGLYLGARS